MSDVKVTIPRDDYNPNQRTDIEVEVVNPDGTVSTRTVRGAVQATTQEDGSVSFGILASAHVPFAAPPTFSPSDVAGLAAWWDVSTITGKSNGDTVSTLTDQSGNGITLTASGSPAYRTNISALNPCVYIPDTAYFNASSTASLDLTGNFLVIGVFYVNTASRGAGAQNTFVSKHFSRYELYEYQGTLGAYVGGTANNAVSSAGEIVSSTAYILAARRTSTSALSVRKSGSSIGSSTNSASATGSYQFTVGRRPGSGSNLGVDAALAELLVYDADVSASDLASIESYLTTKWGL